MSAAPSWFIPNQDLGYSYTPRQTVATTNVLGGFRWGKVYSNPPVRISCGYAMSRTQMIEWLNFLKTIREGVDSFEALVETGAGFLESHTVYIVPDSISYNYESGAVIHLQLELDTVPVYYGLNDNDVSAWLTLYESAYVQYSGSFPFNYDLTVG